MIENPDRIISVVELPDGRIAVQNERDISALSVSDEVKMIRALRLWFRLREGRRRASRPKRGTGAIARRSASRPRSSRSPRRGR
jgi:hypothetical protein